MTEYNITVKKGDTFNGVEFDILRNTTAVSIQSARMQVKKKAKDTTYLLQLISTDGSLIIGASKISLPAQVIDIAAGEYVYDLELTLTTGEIKTWVSGAFVVTQDVTE